MDDEDAKAEVAKGKASLAAARAGRSELSRLDAPQAETELRRVETKLAEVRRRLAREKNLFDAGVTTREMYEEARTTEELVTAEREAALLQLRAASAGGSQSLRAQANVALAQAQLAAAELQLGRHEVRAPADGIIISRRVEPGDAVLSASPLFLLSATGATRLRVEPDERNLALLSIGQPALASAEAFPDDRFAAEVRYIAPSVDPARGTVEVHLLVEEPPDFLRQNMTVSVEITVAEKEEALLISRSSVVAEKADPHVLTLSGGRVNKTPVELGLLGDDVVEVVSGLRASDEVLTAEACAEVSPGDEARVEAVLPVAQTAETPRAEGR
jgi:HlyD family secretion protein